MEGRKEKRKREARSVVFSRRIDGKQTDNGGKTDGRDGEKGK
jgi:hypothetical protein